MWRYNIPEIFLLFWIFSQTIFFIYLKEIDNLTPSSEDIYNLSLFTGIIMFFLYYNNHLGGVTSYFFFDQNESIRFIKLFIVVTFLFVINITFLMYDVQKINQNEALTIVLLCFASLLFLLNAGNLLSFYIIFEFQTLIFFILASVAVNSTYSAEAGIKYFISSIFVGSFFLFGCTLLYLTLGTLNLHDIFLLLSVPLDHSGYGYFFLVYVGVLFVTFTLLFKIGCAPFHFWMPDVYDGSPLGTTIIFSILPKIGFIYFFIKWINCLNLFAVNIQWILLFCGLFSVFLGTFFALSQKKLKKLIIYSSVAQVGFLVTGLSLNSLDGYTYTLFFFVIYIITSILIWTHFVLFYSFQNKINTFFNGKDTTLFISSLSNFFTFNKVWAFSFVIIFFSIAGIPPLSGFLSKVLILFELVNSHHLLSAIFLILISSISVFYYIRFIKIMFFEPKTNEQSISTSLVIFHNSKLDTIYLGIAFLLFLLIFIFFYPTLLLLICQYIVLHISAF